jgi:hypothetical protein
VKRRISSARMLWLVRGAETAALAYVIIAARAWWFPVALFLGLLALALGIALASTRVRLREIKAHDDRQYLWLQYANLGTGFQAGEDDAAAREQAGRRR